MIEIYEEKQFKKYVSPSSFVHFHLTNYDVINTKFIMFAQKLELLDL